MKLAVAILLLISIFGCEKNTTKGMTKTDTIKVKPNVGLLTYLALGDSYTVGHNVTQDQSYPYQLTELLKAKGLNINPPRIIAKTGWTTSELQQGIELANDTNTYDIVTLLIGVNNEYRGQPVETYRTEFRRLLQTAVTFAGGNLKHVFVISIPDWGVTPFGHQDPRGADAIADEIDEFNAINREETAKAGISYTNVTSGSKKAAKDLSLIAADGLHPSGKMYKEWAELLTPAIVKTYQP
jgi:lysophospholipase L1-like esterase